MNDNDFSNWTVGDNDTNNDIWGDTGGSGNGAVNNDVWGTHEDVSHDNDIWGQSESTTQTGWSGTDDITPPQTPAQSSVREPVAFNFGTKTVAIIIAVLLVIGIGVLMFFDGLAKKKQQAVLDTQSVVEQSTSATSEQSVQSDVEQPSQSVQAGGIQLLEIPDTTSLNYSGDVYEANGAVAEKKKFLQGSQVVYCVVVNIAVGASTETVNYYCTYASFNAVSVGDVVVVSYQNVGGKLISVTSISK